MFQKLHNFIPMSSRTCRISNINLSAFTDINHTFKLTTKLMFFSASSMSDLSNAIANSCLSVTNGLLNVMVAVAQHYKEGGE